MDKGRWEWGYHDGVLSVQSEDFKRDVQIVVTGDFDGEKDAKAYMEWLTETLNSASLPTSS